MAVRSLPVLLCGGAGTVLHGGRLSARTVVLPDAPPRGESGMAWREVPGTAFRLEGRIVWAGAMRPAAGSVLRVMSTAGQVLVSLAADSAGVVQWRLPASGRYRVVVVRIGAAPARADIEVRPEAGVQLDVLLAPRTPYLHPRKGRDGRVPGPEAHAEAGRASRIGDDAGE